MFDHPIQISMDHFFIRSAVSLSLISIVIASCGPSAAEQAAAAKRAAVVADSIKQVERVAVEKELLDKKRLSDSLNAAQMNVAALERELMEARADLATREDVLQRVSNFQFGRDRATREQQIHDATLAVEQEKAHIAELEERLPEAKNALTRLQARAASVGVPSADPMKAAQNSAAKMMEAAAAAMHGN